MWREGLSLASSSSGGGGSSSSVCVCWSRPRRGCRACVWSLCIQPAHCRLYTWVAVYSTRCLEAMVPQESTGCTDLSARLHGLVAGCCKTWISCLQLQVLNP